MDKANEDEKQNDAVEQEIYRKSTDFVNAQSQQKETAANFAAQSGSLEILKMLADAGANFTVLNSKGWTPMMAAAAGGYLDCVKYLVEEAKVNPLAKNKRGKTALTYAVINGHIHIVSYLLRLGVHPDL